MTKIFFDIINTPEGEVRVKCVTPQKPLGVRRVQGRPEGQIRDEDGQEIGLAAKAIPTVLVVSCHDQNGSCLVEKRHEFESLVPTEADWQEAEKQLLPIVWQEALASCFPPEDWAKVEALFE